jgi:hypothetical protein
MLPHFIVFCLGPDPDPVVLRTQIYGSISQCCYINSLSSLVPTYFRFNTPLVVLLSHSTCMQAVHISAWSPTLLFHLTSLLCILLFHHTVVSSQCFFFHSCCTLFLHIIVSHNSSSHNCSRHSFFFTQFLHTITSFFTQLFLHTVFLPPVSHTVLSRLCIHYCTYLQLSSLHSLIIYTQCK